MPTRIPHFRRRIGNETDRYSHFIEMDGKPLCKIENMGEFYAAFGYTADTAKSGLLPDEFIWEEYIRNKALSHTECLQLRLIEYLREHSEEFRNQYQEQSTKWIARLAEAISSGDSQCPGCRMKPFCSERVSAVMPEFGLP